MSAPPDCRIATETKMFVLSWNVAGWVPDKIESLEFLFDKMNKDDMPDIVVIGLQEVVELKAKNITSFFGQSEDKVSYLENETEKFTPS